MESRECSCGVEGKGRGEGDREGEGRGMGWSLPQARQEEGRMGREEEEGEMRDCGAGRVARGQGGVMGDVRAMFGEVEGGEVVCSR